MTRERQEERYTADIVVVGLRRALLGAAAAALGQRRPSERAGQRLGPGRPQLHAPQQSVLMAISREPNDTVFQKTLASSDYYFGADDWEFPLGLHPDVRQVARRPDPRRGAAGMARLAARDAVREMARALDGFLAQTRGPAPSGKPHHLDRDGRVVLDITKSNLRGPPPAEGEARRACCEPLGAHPHLFDRSLYLGKNIPIGGTAHQAGTMRFGTDPATSVLDLDCKAHELDNLYVADASFFPSIGAVNPTLTIIANALAGRRPPRAMSRLISRP